MATGSRNQDCDDVVNKHPSLCRSGGKNEASNPEDVIGDTFV